MKKTVNIILIGPGQIGSTVIRQITAQAKHIQSQYQVELHFIGVFSSRAGIYNEKGIATSMLLSFKDHAKNITTNEIEQHIATQKEPCILIDTSASPETYKFMETALKAGGYVVTSNKKPFSSEYPLFKTLQSYDQKIFFETTVGAGLPIISTIRDLIETGDEIVEINGCFSGTLGFLFTRLSEGEDFSKAVLFAKEKGYTEPDPRDDLSGLDVARKALILSRLTGIKRELSDVTLSPLYPSEMSHGSISEFLKNIKKLDAEYKDRMDDASANKQTYKYVATVSKDCCEVGMQLVDVTSDIGALRGPDNIVVIKTKRYSDNPLVIKGPGAGLDVTAGGVFADVLKIVRRIRN